MACRGTGQVVSHLGGGSEQVECPWCRGGGVRLAEVDAQQRWRTEESGAQAVPAAGGAEAAGSSGEPEPPGDAA